MQPDELYREEISFFWGKLAVALFFGMAALFVILFFVQRAYGPIGDEPASDWFYLAMALFYMAFGLIMRNFVKLTVSASPQGLTVSYGRFRHFTSWEAIESVERDERSALRSYGGWGIRYGRMEGGSVLVFNIMGAPLLLLKLRQGKRRYFGFSTRRPDEVISLVRTWARIK